MNASSELRPALFSTLVPDCSFRRVLAESLLRPDQTSPIQSAWFRTPFLPQQHKNSSQRPSYGRRCAKPSIAAESKNDFVAYIDAIGKVNGTRSLIEWKTTSARYPEEPDGLLALDPQLVCYSWMTGISEVAQVVFVRKQLMEVQYLRTVITDEQRAEFGQLVEDTIRRVESAQFLPHSGIRFPQNPCSTCPYVGLCLGKPSLINIALERRPGAENLGWLDELTY
jgi:hypothetical protein